MKQKHWTPHVDDIEPNGISDFDIDVLMALFCKIMQRMERSMARKGWYDMADFEYAQQADCVEYKLTIEKYPHAGAQQWTGLFEAPGKSMKIFGTLEP